MKAWKRRRLQNIVNECLVMSPEQLDFEDDSFDTIVHWHSLNRCRKAVNCVDELRRVVKKDGTVIFVETGRSSFKPIALLQEWVDTQRAIKRTGVSSGPRDVIQAVKMCPELEIVVEIRNTRFTYLVCRKRPSPCTADTITSLTADTPTSLTSDTHTSDTPISLTSDRQISDTPTSHTLGRSNSADEGESCNCNKFEVETEKSNGSTFASPGTSTSTAPSTISFSPTSTTPPESPTLPVAPMSTKPDRSDVHAAIDAEKKNTKH
eukprot:GHVN01022320.1.p1 GENE.GHVN01022320.1~~GHVN01022320.1.p1  ORF type:complete len:264 (-),score=55.32 GHVN01022320.1:490-1281(-)